MKHLLSFIKLEREDEINILYRRLQSGKIPCVWDFSALRVEKFICSEWKIDSVHKIQQIPPSQIIYQVNKGGTPPVTTSWRGEDKPLYFTSGLGSL